MLAGKKGAGYGWILGIIVILVVGFIIYAFASGGGRTCTLSTDCPNNGPCVDHICQGSGKPLQDQLKKVFSSEGGETLPITKTGEQGTFTRDTTEFLFKYVFGMHKGTLDNLGVGKLEELSIRGVMIIIAVWVIFFLVFMDMVIVIGFSGNKIIGFLVGLAVAVIFANFGFQYNIIIYLMGIFSFAAGLSVILALFSIIILGVGAHFGASWAASAIRTKREIWDIRRGGAKAAEGVRLSKKMAEAAAEGE